MLLEFNFLYPASVLFLNMILNCCMFQTVYSVVRVTRGGQSNVISSDGITVLPLGDTVSNFIVNDGPKCSNDGNYITL